MESNCNIEVAKNDEGLCKESNDSKKPTSPKHYSKDELVEFSESPAAKIRPTCLAEEFDGPDGRWDPERWHMSQSGKRSRGPSPIQFIDRRPSDLERDIFRNRRPSDAKERLKEERDGIVLSPQRRSFGHGCQGSIQSTYQRRSGSPLEQKDGGGNHGNSGSQSQRRIGSGRLTNRTRSLDYDDRADRNSGRPGRDRYDRDYEHEKDDGRYDRYGSKDSKRYGKYNSHHGRKEPEPEWYSAGPSSQSETIELRGFNRSDELRKEIQERRHIPEVISVKNRNGSFETHRSSSPETSQDQDTSAPTEDQSFDINQFFNFSDAIPGLQDISVTPDVGEVSQTSRFSQWFSSGGGNPSHSSSHSGSRRSTPHEELESLHELSRINIVPSPEASVFLPITPPDNKERQQAFLEMLHKANINPYVNSNSAEKTTDGKAPVIDNKPKSVSELEAELKELVIGNNNIRKPTHPVVITHVQRPTPPPMTQKGDRQPGNEDLGLGNGGMSAFDKLVFSMKATGNLPSQTKTLLKSDGRPLSPLDVAGNPQNRRPKLNGPGPEPEVLIRPPSVPTPPKQDIPITLQKPEPRMPQQKLSPPPLQIPMPQMGRLTPTFSQKELLQELVKNNQMSSTRPLSSPARPLSPNFFAVNQLKPTPQQQQQMLKNMTQRAISPSQELLGALLKQQQQAAAIQRPQSPQEFLQQMLGQAQSTPRGPSPAPLNIPLSGGRATSPLPCGPMPVPPPSPIGPSPMGPTAPPNTPQSRTPVIPRVPSPQDLVAHTQSIYQQALIKKQLEVQKEKYLAREAARGKSPNPTVQNMMQMPCEKQQVCLSPSAIQKQSTPSMFPAFTPTSVIRKMHETKAEQQTNEILSPQQGFMNTANKMMIPQPQLQTPPQVPKPMEQPRPMMMSPQRQPMRNEICHKPEASPKHEPMRSNPIPIPMPMHQTPSHPPVRVLHNQMRQPNRDTAETSGDIDYNRIREVQLQQQQKAAAAVDGQNNPSVVPTGPVQMQNRPMGQPQLPVPLLQRMPVQPGQGPPNSPGVYPPMMRGMYPGGMNPNVRNMSPMQMQQGSGPGPRPMQQVGNVLPMLMNSRAPFPVTSTGQLQPNAAAIAAMAAMQAQAGLQRSLSQQTQNVPRPDMPNTPPLGSSTGNFSSLAQRSQSPVNLTKWFGNDMLQQPLPQMPPMLHHGQNVFSVEDIECHP
ncbi:uncharacterized protein LOC144448766 isoform X3 [Glandiceps talaboti]